MESPGANSPLLLQLSIDPMFGSRERLYNGWVRDHYRFLFRSAWALTGDRAVAEEVVQDCFELAWRHIDQLRDRALARPWLFRILRREALRNIAPAAATALESYDESRDERTGKDTWPRPSSGWTSWPPCRRCRRSTARR